MRTAIVISFAVLACALMLLAAGCAHKEVSPESQTSQAAPTAEEMKALEKEIAQLREENKQLKESVEEIQGGVEQAKSEEGPNTGMPGLEEAGANTPSGIIDAKITEVKRDGDNVIVILDKGAKNGLVVGAKLFVWNSTEGYKGRITVVEVKDDSSTAKIEWEEEGKEIKVGDIASIQNF